MKISTIALLAGAGLLFATPAAAQQDAWLRQVNAQLEAVADALSEEGLSTAAEPASGALDEGEAEELELELSAGTYLIIGVCDADCSDLDLVLSDGGDEIDSDMEMDDTPVVTVELDGPASLTLRVNMATCSSEPCRYGVGVFRVDG